MKVELSRLEERKLIMAINDESHYRELLQAAGERRQDIFEMIAEKHDIDLSKVDQKSGIIKKGFLHLNEIK